MRYEETWRAIRSKQNSVLNVVVLVLKIILFSLVRSPLSIHINASAIQTQEKFRTHGLTTLVNVHLYVQSYKCALLSFQGDFEELVMDKSAMICAANGKYISEAFKLILQLDRHCSGLLLAFITHWLSLKVLLNVWQNINI